jgi:hypothetical protein
MTTDVKNNSDSLGETPVNASAYSRPTADTTSMVAFNSNFDAASGFTSLKDFGAVGDGVADDTDAINLALASGKTIHVPQGVYNTSGGHQMTKSGQGLIGDGIGSVIFMVENANTPFLSIASLSAVALSGFALRRSVTAVVGGDGIVCLSDVENAVLEDLDISHQYRGLVLGPTAQSSARYITVAQCQSHGVQLQNNASVSQLQWFFETIGVGSCGGCGFFVTTEAGVAPAFLDTWHGCFTFANSGGGIRMVGTTASPIADARITDGFYGTDGGDEIAISNVGTGVGGDHLIANCFFESAGSGSTGPDGDTPASHVGSAISLDASNARVTIANNRIGTMSDYGIVSNAPTIVIVGNKIHDNCQANGVSNSGVSILSGQATITGNLIGNSIGSTQLYGIAVAEDNGHVISGNSFPGNTVAPLYFPGAIINSAISGNVPEVLQAWTPILTFGGSSAGFTYGTRIGSFFKIGKAVVATFQIILTSKGSSTGVAALAGLPFPAGGSNGVLQISYYSSMASLTGAPCGNINAGITSANLFQTGAANMISLDSSNFTNTTTIQGVFTYLTE